MAMRILLTGANGFIGRHLLAQLRGHHELYALVRSRPRTQLPGVHYVVHDLSQPLPRAQLPTHVDAIIHQAALLEPDGADEAAAFRVNVEATWRLLRYADQVGVQTFLHASTGGIYGCAQHPLVEHDPFHPMDLYSLTKAQAELAVQAAPGTFHKIVLRYFFPYGPGTPNPIPRWVAQAVTGAPLPLVGTGTPALNPLHITDAVTATLRALTLGHSATMNIAGTEITSIRAIAEMAAELAGRTPNFVWIEPEAVIPYYRANLVAAIDEMQRQLAFTPQVTLREGIRELVRGVPLPDRVL